MDGYLAKKVTAFIEMKQHMVAQHKQVVAIFLYRMDAAGIISFRKGQGDGAYLLRDIGQFAIHATGCIFGNVTGNVEVAGYHHKQKY